MIDSQSNALVVGLGKHSLEIINHIHQLFDEQNKTDSLKTLWLTPSLKQDQVIYGDYLHLYLNNEALNEIYYHPTTRIWSSVNWKNWGNILPQTRLFGKLSVWYHLPHIYEAVLKLRAQLAGNTNPTLQIYLVSHLHDSFSSGGLIDIAYLLEKLALGRTNIRVTGLLFLPETPNDPITSNYQEEAEKRLYQATTYATIKELNFHLGEHSFYKNHHHQPNVQISTNLPPFYTGDCFMVGGSLDKSMTYPQLVEQVAHWIYIQTATSIQNKLSSSLKHHSFVSTFGTQVVVDSWHFQTSQIDQKRIEAEVLQRILQKSLQTNLSFDIQEIITPPAKITDTDHRHLTTAITQIGLLTSQGHKTNQQAHLIIFEEQYTSVIQQLREQEENQNSAIYKHREKVIQRLTPYNKQGQFYKLRTEDGVTLDIINKQYESIFNEIETERRNYERLIEASRREIEDACRTLKGQRYRFQYTLQPTNVNPYYITFAFVVFSVAGLLLTVGLVIELILWFILAFLIPIIVDVLTRQRQNQAEQTFVKAQRNLAELQHRIIRDRVIGQYYYEVSHEVEEWVLERSTAQPKVQILIQEVEDLHHKQAVNQTQLDWSIPTYDWNRFAPHLVSLLWDSFIDDNIKTDKENYQDIFLERLHILLHEHQLYRQLTNDYRLFGQLLNHARKVAPIGLLTTNQHDMNEIIGIVNWPNTIEDNSRLGHALQIIDLPHYKIADDIRGLVYVRQQTNIPLNKLKDLQTWEEAYKERAIIVDHAQEIKIYYGFLHPTRLGTVTARLHLLTDLPNDFPHLPMLFTVLIRLRKDNIEWKNLAQHYHLSYSQATDLPLSFDELCAAFQTHISDVIKKVNDATKNRLIFFKVTEAIEMCIKRLTETPPKESETYADWEIFTIERIHEYGELMKKSPINEKQSKGISLLGHIIHYILNEERKL